MRRDGGGIDEQLAAHTGRDEPKVPVRHAIEALIGSAVRPD
jgi:hypothetical protein